jgi:hypothetical protein
MQQKREKVFIGKGLAGVSLLLAGIQNFAPAPKMITLFQ